MKITGTYELEADRQKVWEALNDPEVLKACIPGCESLDKTGENELTATVTAKVGPVKAKFNGSVELKDLNPPESYRIEGSGKGGAAGFAKGGADVRLDERDGGGTVLSYEVDAQVGGKLAQIGSRLIDGTAKKLADQFFANFRAHVETPSDDAVTTAPAADDAPTAESEEKPAQPVAPTDAADDDTPAPEMAVSDTPQPETEMRPTPQAAPAQPPKPTQAPEKASGLPAWVWFLAAAGLILVLVALVS
ncbi:MAG: SRPBCC domain-containing protein [Minwuia sp.]|nr:SRPBCC domain-containing protein [Minwuia sp.]